MTLFAFAAAAALLLGQQSAPLVSQTELAPPASVQQPAPVVAAPPPAVQPAPQGQFAQQQQAQEPPAPVRLPERQAPSGRNETRGSGGKRVVAFWVILPDATK